MAPFTHDLVPLFFQWQSVDIHHIVQHAGEHRHHFTKGIPVKGCTLGERVTDKFGQVDATQQAGSVRREGLFATVMGIDAVGIKGVDAGNLDIIDILHPIRRDRFHRSYELRTTRPLLVVGQQRTQSLLFAAIGKTDAIGKTE